MAKTERRVKSNVLLYPDNLNDRYTYPDIIQMNIVKRAGLNLDKASRVFSNQLRNLAGADNSGLTTEQKRVFSSALNANEGKPLSVLTDIIGNQLSAAAKSLAQDGDPSLVAEILSIPTGIIATALGRALNNGSSVFKGGTQSTEVVSVIHLPMPDNLTYNEQIEWQSVDLGAIGGLSKGESKSDGLGAGLYSQLGTIISGGTGALVSSVLGAGVAGGAVLGALGGGNVLQGTVESKLRVKSNPFKEQTFQGLPFRPFEFSWTFSPTSPKEVTQIHDIINTLREYSKPSYSKGPGGDSDAGIKAPSSFFFNYPHEVAINFYTSQERDKGRDININEGVSRIQNPTTSYQLKPNKYLPCLKHCIIKSINTNFATAGWHSFTDGAPTSITLQIQLEEIEIVTAEDVKDRGF
mgnify:CR=1 FL=1